MAFTTNVQWTDKMDKFLQKKFHVLSTEEIAREMGLTKDIVKYRIKKTISATHREKKNWSEYEDDMLLTLYGKVSDAEMEKRLRRSWWGIRMRMQKLEGMTNVTLVSSQLSPKDVADLVGVDNTTVIHWCNEGKIPFNRPNLKILFEDEQLYKWLKKNLDKVNPLKVNSDTVAIAPKWYKDYIKEQQREIFKSEISVKHNTYYSQYEKTTAIDLYNKGYKIKDIAEELDRTYSSVKNFIYKNVNKG